MSEVTNKIIALLMVVMLVLHWKVVSILFPISAANYSLNSLVIVLAGLFLVLNLVGAFGVYKYNKFGLWFGCAAIIFSTIFFSVAYVPFISKLIITHYRTYVTMGLNAALVVMIIILYRRG